MVIAVDPETLAPRREFGQSMRVSVCGPEYDRTEDEAGAASGTSLFRPRHPLGV
jgi:hypothetical protein